MPNTLRSQTIITITTTTFKIFLIFLSIGMYELTSHRSTPATINTSKIVNSGIKIRDIIIAYMETKQEEGAFISAKLDGRISYE